MSVMVRNVDGRHLQTLGPNVADAHRDIVNQRRLALARSATARLLDMRSLKTVRHVTWTPEIGSNMNVFRPISVECAPRRTMRGTAAPVVRNAS